VSSHGSVGPAVGGACGNCHACVAPRSRYYATGWSEQNPEPARPGGGGLFTIHIAEEDRPRRWRAHRHCTNGRAVSPITCWVALVPKAEWAGGRRLLLSSGTTLLVGAPGRCSGRRAQLKPPFPVPVGRGRSYTAPGAPGLHSPRRCRVKKEHTCWPHLDRNVEVNPGRRLSFASKVCLWG